MDRIGLSFRSPLTPDEVRTTYVQPLRSAIEADRCGIYSNYLRQTDDDPAQVAEHLLVFQVHDFETGLRLLRTVMQRVGMPAGMMFHNLNPSAPAY